MLAVTWLLVAHQQPQAAGSPTIFGVDQELFFAVLGAVFVAYQVVNARRQRRLSELQGEREWRRGWAEQRDGWALACIAVRGVDDYYAVGSAELRALVVEANEAEMAATGSSYEHATWERATRAAQQVEVPIRKMLHFLDSLAQEVVNGRLTPRVAYLVVGREIVRSSAVVRALIGPAYATNASAREGVDELEALHEFDRLESPHSMAGWLSYHPGIRMRLLVLLDVLWAEACRRGDLSVADTDSVAMLKRRTHSGLRDRVRIGRVCGVERTRPGAALTISRLRRLLIWSEHPARVPGPEERAFETYTTRTAKQGSGVLGFLRRARVDTGSLHAKPVKTPAWGSEQGLTY